MPGESRSGEMQAGSRRNRWVNLALVAAIVAIVGIALAIDSGRTVEGDRFVGSDTAATERIEADHPDYQPWFESVFAPSSGEVESGLFALQAALGGIVLGYVIATLKARRAVERVQAPPDGS
ncbi:energy-coupling factor ABC transporter substrate-binding protein [Rhodococcoides corynebacterioides]|uniref:energy-coupling factor ABC transporter substrate-binding protein n=1 Tax=Rhodococcoides corynebacterioides TaxID=53972 RepID=UPI003F815365